MTKVYQMCSLFTRAVSFCSCLFSISPLGAPSPTLNVTVFSFSLDSSYPLVPLDDSSVRTDLSQSFRRDLELLTGAPPARILLVELRWRREPDPQPELVQQQYDGNNEEKGELQPHQQQQRTSVTRQAHLTSILARSSGGGGGGGFRHKFRTQSLDLIRIDVCFTPEGFQPDGSYYATPAAQYIDVLTLALRRWQSGDRTTLPSLAQGNITRSIDATIPMTIEPGTSIVFCPDEGAGEQYRLECPEKDSILYWGTTGLTVAIVLSISLFLILFFTVWCVYIRYENRRRRGYMHQIKPEYRQIVFGSHNTRFKQHTLPIWQPQWEVRNITMWMVIFGIGLLLPLGIWSTHINSNVKEVRVRYDNLPECDLATTSSTSCNVLIPIPSDMSSPIYMYYELRNFYQNHRNYVMSRSDSQLRNANGKGSSTPNLGVDCQALRYFQDWNQHAEYPFQNNVTEMLQEKTLYPCGLIAASFFTDTFPSARVTTEAIIEAATSTTIVGPRSYELQGRNWESRGIAWDSDRSYRYRQRDLDVARETRLNPRGLSHTPVRGLGSEHDMTLPSIEDEDFIVWMRVAPFETFAKLNHKILDRDFKKGEVLNVTVETRFDTKAFDGQKWIVLANVHALGSKNQFFSVAYLLVGSIYACTGIIFYLVFRHDPAPISPELTLQLALDAQAQSDQNERLFEARMNGGASGGGTRGGSVGLNPARVATQIAKRPTRTSLRTTANAM